MCNYKSGFYTIEDLEFYYGAMFGTIKFSEEFKEQFVPHYYENAFDHFASPVMTAPGEFGLFSWGLVPPWVKSLDRAMIVRKGTVNARSEEMFETASFRDSLKAGKRCLIPATGFFEWQWFHPDAKKSEKQPYFVRTKNKLFSFAGLWSEYTDDATNRTFHTYTIVTTEPNPMMSKIHNHGLRMPLILHDENLKDWLNPDLTKDEVMGLCQPFDENLMEAWTIDRKISNRDLLSAQKDVADIIKEVEPYAPTQTETKIKAKKLKGDPGQGSLF